MNTTRRSMPFTTAFLLCVASGLAAATSARAQSSEFAFTYQGELRSGGVPANGLYDLRMEFLNASSAPVQTVCADNVMLTDGRFTVLVDPGAAFPSAANTYKFVRIAVRNDTGGDCSNVAGFVDLLPVQRLTYAPMASQASYAASAQTANSLQGFTPAYFTNAQNLTGTLPLSSLGPTVPLTNASNVFTGTNTFASIQTSGGIDNPAGPLLLRTNGNRGLMIDFRSGHPNIIAGSSSNAVLSPAYGAAISGGLSNQISAAFANIGGGSSNVVSIAGDSATIGGGSGNQAQAFHATIGGGYFNTVVGSNSVVGGGAHNSVTALFGTIAGGAPVDLFDVNNTNNRVTDDYGVVGGGGGNRAGNGAGTTQDANYATVGGGRSNRASGQFSSVVGGSGNTATTQYASVGGGVNNNAGGSGFSTVAGGSENDATGFVATVAGGDFNLASGDRSTIGGGNGHITSGAGSTIAGGFGNQSQAFASFVGGGNLNTAGGDRSSVGGGFTNQATGSFATVAGGYGNQALAYISTVGGGDANTASGDRAVVGGGFSSVASGSFATIAGGIYNQATAYGATVVGGDANIASGQWSSVLGGIDNQATQLGSFAGGTRTRANHEGSFVWSDRSDLGSYTVSTAPNQVTVRAGGGVRVIGNVGVSGNINFTSPRQTFRMYCVGEFLPATRNSPDVPVRTGFYGELIAGPSLSSITFRVPLNLPQGARIRDISVYYNDNDSTRFMRFFVLRTLLPGQTASELSVVTTEAAPGSQRTAVLPIPTPIVVDNQSSSLEFVVEPQRPSGPGWVTEWSSTLQLAGMRVTYETDGPTQ